MTYKVLTTVHGYSKFTQLMLAVIFTVILGTSVNTDFESVWKQIL